MLKEEAHFQRIGASAVLFRILFVAVILIRAAECGTEICNYVSETLRIGRAEII